jgi:hypothetical protein
MELPVYNMAGQQVSTYELPPGIFDADVNRALMHQALVRQLANARQGTHKAKTRARSIVRRPRFTVRKAPAGRATAAVKRRFLSAAARPTARCRASIRRICRARCAGPRCAPRCRSKPARAILSWWTRSSWMRRRRSAWPPWWKFWPTAKAHCCCCRSGTRSSRNRPATEGRQDAARQLSEHSRSAGLQQDRHAPGGPECRHRLPGAGTGGRVGGYYRRVRGGVRCTGVKFFDGRS